MHMVWQCREAREKTDHIIILIRYWIVLLAFTMCLLLELYHDIRKIFIHPTLRSIHAIKTFVLLIKEKESNYTG